MHARCVAKETRDAHDPPKGSDTAAVTTLITDSIHDLLVRAGQVVAFNDIALDSAQRFARSEAAFAALLSA
jgi:hypothetical protein